MLSSTFLFFYGHIGFFNNKMALFIMCDHFVSKMTK